MSEKKGWDSSWKEEKKLGYGGQGRTFLVKHNSNFKLGVLKLLIKPKDPQARRRMFQEVGNLKVVSNAGGKVPIVLDGNTDQFESKNINLYFVMEYIEGKNLAEFIKESDGLSLDEASKIVFDLYATIEKAHKEKVIHRDIKPENIIIRDHKKPDIFIVDYGLSFNQQIDKTLTRPSEMLDNKFLSLPERRIPGGDRRDPRSDITGLCAILYYCIIAEPPVDLRDNKDKPPHRRNEQKINEKLKNDPRISYLFSFFDRGFQIDIDNRFQTLEEFYNRLRDVMNPSAKQTQKEDIFQFATETKNHFRKHDKETQIELFKSNSQDFVTIMNKVRSKYSVQQLLPFLLGLGGYDQKFSLTEGQKLNLISTTLVSFENHQDVVMIVYEIRARGTECEIYKKLFRRWSSHQGQWASINDWQCIYRYDGFNVPNWEIVEKDFEATIKEACEILREIIENPREF